MFVQQPIVLALVSLVGFVATQAVDPTEIDEGTKAQWCLAQQSQCPLLCMQVPGAEGDPAANDCDTETLTYDCVCSNGQSPNATEYSQTIPYFLCTEANNRCVANCGDNSGCASACRENNPCGAQDPTRVTTTSSTMQATASSTASATDTVYSGLGGDSSGGNPNAASRPFALEFGHVYGLGVLIAGFLGGFALVI